MARPTLNTVDRARGLLLGLAAGEAVARGASDWSAGEAALAGLLASELGEPDVDLHRLAHRWLDWWRRDGEGLGPATADALAFLAAHDAPPPAGPAVGDASPLVRCLPLGVALAASPRNLVSGTYHVVMLTHPDPLVAWAAVAVNVAVARLAQGRRDVVPDVIEVLGLNDVPPDLLGAMRRVPLLRRQDLRWGQPEAHGPAAAAELAIWLAHHEPVLQRAVEWALTLGDAGLAAPLAAGVLGARDGEVAIPRDWLARIADPDRWRQLARRLVSRPAG